MEHQTPHAKLLDRIVDDSDSFQAGRLRGSVTELFAVSRLHTTIRWRWGNTGCIITSAIVINRTSIFCWTGTDPLSLFADALNEDYKVKRGGCMKDAWKALERWAELILNPE